jgi:hypothetical protein
MLSLLAMSTAMTSSVRESTLTSSRVVSPLLQINEGFVRVRITQGAIANFCAAHTTPDQHCWRFARTGFFLLGAVHIPLDRVGFATPHTAMVQPPGCHNTRLKPRTRMPPERTSSRTKHIARVVLRDAQPMPVCVLDSADRVPQPDRRQESLAWTLLPPFSWIPTGGT